MENKVSFNGIIKSHGGLKEVQIWNLSTVILTNEVC